MRECKKCINLSNDNFCYLNDKFIFNNTEAEFCNDYLSDDIMLNDKELRCELTIINKIDKIIANNEKDHVLRNNNTQIEERTFKLLKKNNDCIKVNIEHKSNSKDNMIKKQNCNNCKYLTKDKRCRKLNIRIKNILTTKCMNYEYENVGNVIGEDIIKNQDCINSNLININVLLEGLKNTLIYNVENNCRKLEVVELLYIKSLQTIDDIIEFLVKIKNNSDVDSLLDSCIFSENKKNDNISKGKNNSILESTYDDMIDFKFFNKVERNELIDTENRNRNHSVENTNEPKRNEVDKLRKEIKVKINNLPHTQRRTANFIADKLETIPEYENLEKLSSTIGVSPLFVTFVLTKLKLGSFENLKEKISNYINK